MTPYILAEWIPAINWLLQLAGCLLLLLDMTIFIQSTLSQMSLGKWKQVGLIGSHLILAKT